MVEVVERVALRDWSIEDQQGNRQDVYKGKSYTTTKNRLDDGKLMLFSHFWVRVPADVFISCCPHCGGRMEDEP